MVASKRVLLYYYYVNRLLEIVNKININGSVTLNEKMSDHTTFRCGGHAELFIRAKNIDDVVKIKNASVQESIPLFILGGGANILVSDLGIPGITLSLINLNEIELNQESIEVEAGATVNDLCDFALKKSLTGLEFIYGMPGSIGGAVWMNARCYGDEISNHFLWADYITPTGDIRRVYKNSSDWDYKVSPFQNNEVIILRVALQLKTKNSNYINSEMRKNRQDRRTKGHFKYPCAGSIFKNNREFGSPSGKIIEDAGLKGEIKGGAQISTFHGNIIINLGNATSSDINFLINKVIDTVKQQKGIVLEPEILKVGNWED